MVHALSLKKTNQRSRASASDTPVHRAAWRAGSRASGMAAAWRWSSEFDFPGLAGGGGSVKRFDCFNNGLGVPGRN